VTGTGAAPEAVDTAVRAPAAPSVSKAVRRPAGTGVARWVFPLCLVVTFANFAVWSWATPLFASPDEPTQVARAAAVVRGEFVGTTVGSDRNAMTTIRIPDVLAAGEPMVGCFQFRDTVPASCQPAMPSSTAVTSIHTYVGRYPPLYYVIVGIPSLFAVSVRGIYLMRLAAALLDALFVSLALFTVWRWSRNKLLLVAIMAAATPQVWFLGSVVNPSGFEIAAAICLWTSGAVLLLEHAHAPPYGLVAVVAVSFCAFVLTRPLSPLWCAITLLVLGIAGGWGRVRALLGSRPVQWAIAPSVACAAFAVGWIVDVHSLDLEASTAPVPQPETFTHLVPVIFGHTWLWTKEMIGLFGWLDAPAPKVTYVIVGVVVGAAVLTAFARAARGRREAREAGAVALLILAVVVAPVAIVYREVHRLGIVWQGRDILPLAVGIPVLAVAVLGAERAGRRWSHRATVGVCAAVCVLLGVAGFAAFFEALRRYAVGLGGPVDFLSGTWHPPLGNTAALVAAFVSIAALELGVWLGVARSRAPIVDAPTDSLMGGDGPRTGDAGGLDAGRRPGS
jgi:Predicted membrane protein (DUF2142)